MSRSTLEIRLLTFLRIGISCVLVITIASVFLFTAGFDETWILSSIHRAVDPSASALYDKGTVLSTGGLYALIQYAVCSVAGPGLWALRILPLISLLILLLIARSWSQTAGLALAAPAALLSIAGSSELSASAYGEVPATLCIFAGVAAWDRSSPRWLWSGIAFGLAIATRQNCLVILPALLIWGLWHPQFRMREVLVTVVLAVITAGAAMYCYDLLTPSSMPSDGWREASGMNRPIFDYPTLLNRWTIASEFFPLPLVFLSLLTAYRCGRSGAGAWTLLGAYGALLWLAWVTRAPIPHLRYLWPGIAGLACVLGLGLAHLYRHSSGSELSWVRVAIVGLLLTGVFSSLGRNVRSVAVGDINILSWEWSRETYFTGFRRFQKVQDQWAMVNYIRSNVQDRETIGAVGSGTELGYLTSRKIPSLDEADPNSTPAFDHLVMTPRIGRDLYLNPKFTTWLEENCKVEARFGAYVLYKPLAPLPERSIVQSRHSPRPIERQ